MADLSVRVSEMSSWRMDKNGDWMGIEHTCAQLCFRKAQQGDKAWNMNEMWDLEGYLAHSRCSAQVVIECGENRTKATTKMGSVLGS